jgi:hypothetical protein
MKAIWIAVAIACLSIEVAAVGVMAAILIKKIRRAVRARRVSHEMERELLRPLRHQPRSSSKVIHRWPDKPSGGEAA